MLLSINNVNYGYAPKTNTLLQTLMSPNKNKGFIYCHKQIDFKHFFYTYFFIISYKSYVFKIDTRILKNTVSNLFFKMSINTNDFIRYKI